MQDCPRCGITNTNSVDRCENCALDLRTPSGFRPATFWQRTKAIWLDGMVLVIPYLFVRTLGLRSESSPGFQGVWAVMVWSYFALFESSAWQATPGKRLIGLRVVDLQGHRITFLRASGRCLARGLSAILGIGYLMALFTRRKQTLHDILASCLVVDPPRNNSID